MDAIGVDDSGKTVLLFKMIGLNGKFHLKKVHEIPFPNEISDITIDKNGVIHVSCYDHVCKIKFSKNNFIKALNDHGKRNVDTRGFLELPNKEILAATNSGIFKLKHIDGDSHTESSYEVENIFPSLNFLKSFVKTNDSTVWCLGNSKGLWEINSLQNKIDEIYIFHSHPKLANLHYNDIVRYSDSTLLLASSFDLQEFNIKQKKFREVPIPVLGYNREIFVSDIYKTEDKLYIGTDVHGLIIKDLSSNTFLHLNNDLNDVGLTLPSNKINSIFVDGGKNLWLGTDKGAVRIDKDLKKLEVVNAANGLTNLNVVGILEDLKNICGSAPTTVYTNMKKVYRRLLHFILRTDFHLMTFNLNSYYKTSTDRLLFGGVKGLIAFDSINDTPQSQGINIFPTKLEYFDADKEKEVKHDVLNHNRYSFNLPYNHNSFSASYSINDCYNTDTNKYAYQLKGLSDEWVNMENQTTLKLLSIPPGDYVLNIKGFNSTGTESSNILRYDIHVAQVFYKQSCSKS